MKKKKVLTLLMTLTLSASMCPMATFAANVPAAVEAEDSEAADEAEQEDASAEEETADTKESEDILSEVSQEEETADAEESEDITVDVQEEDAEALNAVDVLDDASVKEDSANNVIDAVGTEKTGAWVLMNIPYDAFYAADMKRNNEATIDAFSSATQIKVRNAGMANGSYHIDDEENNTTNINGVTFPVWVEDIDALRGLGYTEITSTQTKNVEIADGKSDTKTVEYTGKDILFGEPDYSFYVLTDAEWNSNEYTIYKKATIEGSTITFGETLNKSGKEISDSDITVIKDSGYTLKESSTWGDYELDLSTEIAGEDITDYVLNGTTDVYGIVITAVSNEDGEEKEYDYPLRHIENMWKIYELSWNTGFLDTVHGCTVTWDPYMSLPGQSISYVTYYTNTGIYKVQLCDKNGNAAPAKVLKKYRINMGDTEKNETATAPVSAGTISLALDDAAGDPITEGIDPSVTIKGLAGVSYEDGYITWNADSALAGSYSVTVADNSGDYATLSETLILSTDKDAAQYDAEQGKLTAASGSSAANLANYLKNITAVKVGDTNYAVGGGGHGKASVTIINADGSINWDVKDGAKAVFENGKTYSFTVTASGYPALKFSATKVEIQKAWIAAIASQVYSGKAITPAITVKDGNKTLTSGTHYKVSYRNNTNAGTATVNVTGLGKYSGTATITFTINQAASSITLANKTVTYNGRAVAIDAAKVTGSNGNITYNYYSDKNCTKSVSAANVKNAGTYYVKATVAASTNYKAATSTAATLTINKAASTVTLANKTVTATGKQIAMTGAKVTGSTGKVSYNYYSNKSCTKAVSASKVKKAGTYYVKAKVAASTNYKAATSSAAKLVIKPAQTITYKNVKVTYKASELKSAKKTFKIGAASKQKGKISYTKASNAKKTLSVDKNGKVTVKKKLKKGTYTLNVKVTAAAKGKYGKTTVTKKITVKVK